MAPEDGDVFASIDDAAKAYVETPEEDTPETDNRIPEGDDVTDPEGEDELASDDNLTDVDDDTQDAADDDLPESDGGRFAADNAKVKLADGTVTTISDLKKGSLLHGDWTRKTQAVSAKEQAITAKEAEVQSFAAKLQQERETVAAFAQYMLPKRPDPKMIEEGDIIGFNLANEAYTRQMETLGKLNADYQAYQQQVQEQEAESLKETKKQEWERLKERAPDLAKPEKYQQFWSEALKAGDHYGFTPDELNGLTDHRQYLVLKDALAYRRIKARSGQQPNPKVQGKPPVINGDRRRTAGEAQQREVKTAVARLTQTGSLKDGVAALIALEKG